MTREVSVAVDRSKIGAAFALCAGAATLALLHAMPLPSLVRAFAVLWIGAATLDAYRLFTLRGREIRLGLEAIEVRDGVDRVREGTLRDGSFVAPWLTIVRWRPRGAAFDRTLVVLPDMLPAPAFRELRVLLRGQTTCSTHKN
jgi:hypothetical protein